MNEWKYGYHHVDGAVQRMLCSVHMLFFQEYSLRMVDNKEIIFLSNTEPEIFSKLYARAKAFAEDEKNDFREGERHICQCEYDDTEYRDAFVQLIAHDDKLIIIPDPKPLKVVELS